MDQTYLTIGTCWKGEEEYALDFVRYHSHIGVERFIIYDREYNEISRMFVDNPAVIVKPFPECPANIHSTAWAGLIGDCQTAYPTTWLALIDADQVLVPVKGNDMRDVLKDYEEYASLQLNWHTYGSSGHENKTEGSLYQRFTKRARANEGINGHTQTICQPLRTLAVQTADPHHVKLPSNEISVNTNKGRVMGPFNRPALHDVAWVAHYISKSRSEWAAKNAKGRADIHGEKMPFKMFDDHEAFCNAEEEKRVVELWNQCSHQQALFTTN
jgi:Glycosyltransferase family 92